MPASTHLEIIPLGGLGEFGMNLMVYRYGNDCVIVDAGMMFPGAEHLGVDVVIPDFSFLDECGTLHGVILSHGHEDHIGALPYLLQRHDLSVYASPYTLELIRRRLVERDLGRAQLNLLPEGEATLRLGPFGVETLPVTHSIPQARMIVLRTPLGSVVHTADFKLDPNPVEGPATDLSRLAALGREGVLLLLSDSTNADRPGFTPGERTVGAGLDRILAGTRSRVLVTTFASNVPRIQQLIDVARRHDRHIAIVGSSMETHCEISTNLGILRSPVGTRVNVADAMALPRHASLIAVTGTQGEPMSALSRIAVDKHREIQLEPGDLVLHSARKIPGNEKSIDRTIGHLMRRGAEVITADDAPIHVSGHPAQDELQLLIALLRPRFFVPIHGEFRQLRAHAKLAVDSGLGESSVQLAESGDVVVVGEDSIEIGGQVHVGQIFLDAAQEEVDRSLLRDRKRVAYDGIVVAVVGVNRNGDRVTDAPEIVSRGFVPDANDELMRSAKQVVVETLADTTPEERADEAILKARIQSDLRRFLRRRTQRQPLIIPVILEL